MTEERLRRDLDRLDGYIRSAGEAGFHRDAEKFLQKRRRLESEYGRMTDEAEERGR